jgi:NAD(P)-dependent dehydrogenase (short-subunit alcohol dehydrogenase family)
MVVPLIPGSTGLSRRTRRGRRLAGMNTTKVALVTGANKGIGYHTACLLGRHGMTVLIGARDPHRGTDAAKAIRTAGIDAHALPLDVTDAASIRRAAESIEAEHGRLDILVNNAGIAGRFGDAGDNTAQRLRQILETNVAGVVEVTEAVLPMLRAADAARIVNVSSELGSIGCTLDRDSPMWNVPVDIPYPTSKAALNMVTAMYAKQLHGTPIKVNAANPGYCATDLNGNSGFRTAQQGAEVVVHLATLPDDGPTGVLWGHLWNSDNSDSYGVLPW